jgi:SAM-dependent methyltransferase
VKTLLSSEILHSRLKVRIREAERRFLRLFNCKSSRDVEYDFAHRNVFGDGLKILDIGGCESLLPLMLAKRGFKVTVYDFRHYTESHPNLTSIAGSFLENKLPDDCFDYVILVSTIEHIGFGSYQAPRYEDGDMKAMTEVKRLLSPDGRTILTFPFTDKHTVLEGFERWYDTNRVKELFQDMYILKEEHWVPEIKALGRWIKWKPGTLREAQTSLEDCDSQSIACYVVSLNPPNQSETFFHICNLNKQGA